MFVDLDCGCRCRCGLWILCVGVDWGFSNRTAFRLGDYYTWTFCHSVSQQVIPSAGHSVSHNLKPCDWSTRFMRVISLGLSSVNRFCSTDWDTAKCLKVVYRSVHICPEAPLSLVENGSNVSE